MYSRTLNGQEYSFGVSGKLIRNTLVMYDRETGSLWSQLLGQAVDGPLAGTSLEYVPAVHTTWADWRRQHPNTLALVKGFVGHRDAYAGYFRSGDAGVIGETFRDDRLETKALVIGVASGDSAAAYPFSVLNQAPVVNDRVGDLPVLVLFDPATGAGRVYDRRVGDETLSFRLQGPALIDEATGSTWQPETGRALDGPMAGMSLTRVKSTASFWFGWKDWYPATRVYGLDVAPPEAGS